MIEAQLTRWLDYWHGNGEAHQFRYYRCDGCRRIVTWTMIHGDNNGHEGGGCPCGMTGFIRPARLSRREKFHALFLPWSLNRHQP